MSYLFLIRGLPGSGKTSLAAHLKVDEVHSADDYFTSPDGAYNFDHNKLHKAHTQCILLTEKAMQEGKTIAVANTFTTEKELKPYIEMAKDYNYAVFSIVVENRHGNSSIHDVPEATMFNMKNRFVIKL